MLFDPLKKKLLLDGGSSVQLDAFAPPVTIPGDDLLTSWAGSTAGLAPVEAAASGPGLLASGWVSALSALSSPATTTVTTTGTTVTATSGTATATSYPSWFATLSTASIAADMRAADANGTVGAAGLTRLLTDLVGTLSTSHNSLTSGQLTDLRTIAANLNNGVSTSANLVYALSALANGNAMNATWTGGAAVSAALGNLAVGSSATVLGELTGKWFSGTDLPSSSVTMQGAGTFTVNYSAVNKALFGSSGPSASDINQGYLGDCYLLSSAAEVASQNAALITNMFTVNDNGTCSVRFYENGAATYVTVNTQLANGGTIFNEGSNTWASFLEKAYAELQVGGVWTGNSAVNYGNSYSTIGNGGDPAHALEEITGATALTEYYANGGSWFAYKLNGSLGVTGTQSAISTSSLQQTLVTALSGHNDVILSSYTHAADSAGRTTLVANHAMSITSFDTTSGQFVIRNPWGSYSGQSWDTTFEVSLSSLLGDGDIITVDNAGSKTGAGTASAPVLVSATAGQTWKLGSSVNFALPASTFRDPQGQALAYTATLSNGAALPSWLAFNAATATFTGTVPTSAGAFSIKVTATDTAGLSASEIFSVQTPASAPVLALQTGTVSFVAGKTSSYTLAGTTFSDPQGQALTLAARQSNGSALPAWLSFNAATRTLTGTPPAGSSGLQVVITATNTSGLSASETFALATPKPAAPLLTAQTAAQTIVKGSTVAIQLAANTFTDPNGEAITYSARQSSGAALPAWLSFNAATRTFQGTAPTTTGSVGLTVTATDAGGASASEVFSLSIAAAASTLIQSASLVGSSGSLASLTPTQLSGTTQTTLAVPLH